MQRVLLTGMSGTGKTTVVRRLVALGFKAVDLDDGWCEPQPDGRQRWREAAVGALLDQEDAPVLFVAGCEENMATFLPRFDQVVLLTAPVETLLHRLASRTHNPYGKRPEERARFLADVRHVEPRLRRVAQHQLVTTIPVDELVGKIVQLVVPP